MTEWTAAYRRLYKFLNGYTGSKFIKTVLQVDPTCWAIMTSLKVEEKAQ